jgi:hypothetical protein
MTKSDIGKGALWVRAGDVTHAGRQGYGRGADLPHFALDPSVVDCERKSSPQKGGASFWKPSSEPAYSTPAKAPAAKSANAA